jgi:Ca2+-binding RTX toxin-like protein
MLKTGHQFLIEATVGITTFFKGIAMTAFFGSSGNDTLTAIAGDDVYQLGEGNDTLYFNATVDASGVLTWNNGFDTVISTDGGLAAPNADRIVVNFLSDYIWSRKVGDDLELSIHAHLPTGNGDPVPVEDEVGKITLKNAFTASPADRISRIEGPGFYMEAIAAPVADKYGHTAIYKMHALGSGDVQFEESYMDINFHETRSVKAFTDGRTVVRYFDSDATQAWYDIAATYTGYGTALQTLIRTERYNDDNSMSVSVPGSSANDSVVGSYGNDSLNGAAGSDSLSGGGGNDSLNGGTGNDQLRGEAGNDTLVGGDENDYLTGGSGDDVLSGGNGIDTADYLYSDTSAGVIVNLTSGRASGGGGNDTLTGIENVNGSNFNDTLTGNAENNALIGNNGDDLISAQAGNDTLNGGSGNDTLNGGAGFDVLIGGAGNDTLNGGVVLDHRFNTDFNSTNYGYATAGVNINLSGITGKGSTGSGTASGDASVGVDSLMNINLVSGSNFNDTITGSSALIFEQFEGGGGNDTLDGGAITDTLNGDNRNSVTYQNTTGAGVTVDLIAGSAVGAAGSNAGSDTLVNFNMVRGSNFNDTLLGSDRTDVTEQFEGYAGNDVIDGRGGFDFVRYNNATSQVIVNLATGLATGAMGNDTLTGIEAVSGGSGHDILTGGNALNGVTVSDGLAEVFRGEAGNDTIDGGQGYDRADYVNSTSGVVVVLNDTLDGSASDGLGGTDVLRHIEGVQGSAFDDVLVGSNSAAFESFDGREGHDMINGNGGIDRADYEHARAGVNVNLTSGVASDGYGGTDTLSNIENVRGSRNFNDTLTGNAANNKLEGLGGNDILLAGAGKDILDGGLGSDILRGGAGADKLTGGAGADKFDFNFLADTGLTSTTMDTILDFKTSEGDKIDLLDIDADTALIGNQAFTFLGMVSAFTGDATAQLRFDAATHIVYGSTDADTAAEFAIALTGVNSLASTDFVL